MQLYRLPGMGPGHLLLPHLQVTPPLQPGTAGELG